MILGILFVLLFSTTSAQGPYNPCKGSRHGDRDWKVIDPYDCSKFYMCHGQRAYHMACAPGTSFSHFSCVGPHPATVRNCYKGVWDQWSNWSKCSVTCGQGFRQRTRNCQGNQHTERQKYSCRGPKKDYESCSAPACIEELSGQWDEWSDWGPCSATCGLAKRQRTRDCIGFDCQGEHTETQSCTDLPQCAWENWSTWSPCSATCGTGRQSRHRLCNEGQEQDCHGDFYEYKMCDDLPPCLNVEGTWTPWSMWSACSTSCGNGIKQRVRKCKGPAECTGSMIERESCGDLIDIQDHPECNDL